MSNKSKKKKKMNTSPSRSLLRVDTGNDLPKIMAFVRPKMQDEKDKSLHKIVIEQFLENVKGADGLDGAMDEVVEFDQATLINIAKDGRKASNINSRFLIGSSISATYSIRTTDALLGGIEELHDSMSELEWNKIFLPAAKGRIAAYTANITLLNTPSAMLDEIMKLAPFDTFDYEKAITSTQWNFPLTGNLYNDLVSNHMYSYVKNMKYDAFMQVLSDLCIVYAKVIAENFKGAQFSYAPVLPVFLDPYFEIKDMFCEPELTKASEAERNIESNALMNTCPELGISAQICNLSYAKMFLDTRWYKYGLGGTMNFNMRQTFDNTMHKPSKTTQDIVWRGFFNDTTNYFGGVNQVATEQDNSFVYLNYEFEDDEDESDESLNYKHLINDTILLSKLIDRERYDFYRELERINAKKKDAKSTDKALNAALAENRKLADRLSAAEKKATQIQTAEIKSKRTDYLEERLRELQEENAALKKKNDYITTQLRASEQEIDILQKLTKEEADEIDDSEEIDLDTSIFDSHRVVVVGGHARWLARMKDLSDSIVFLENRMNDNDEALANADVIWVQPNCISHSLFYKVTDICSRKGIPMRYFASAGHVACRNQMVRETKEILA